MTRKTVIVKCATCGQEFEARIADRKRGWAKCCSKSCATSLKNRKTGNYARFCAMRSYAREHELWADQWESEWQWTHEIHKEGL